MTQNEKEFLVQKIRTQYTEKEHTALDEHEVGGHDDKFPRHLHIHQAHLLDIFEILLQNESDGNIVNIHFVFGDQREEKVKRAFKHLQLKAQITHKNGTNPIIKSNAAITPPLAMESIGSTTPEKSIAMVTSIIILSYLIIPK